MMKNYETPDIIESRALDNYLIYLKYETKEERIYDMNELISKNEFYNKLKNKKYFKNLKTRGDSVEWENGEDVSPENLYYDSVKLKEFQGTIKELD